MLQRMRMMELKISMEPTTASLTEVSEDTIPAGTLWFSTTQNMKSRDFCLPIWHGSSMNTMWMASVSMQLLQFYIIITVLVLVSEVAIQIILDSSAIRKVSFILCLQIY